MAVSRREYLKDQLALLTKEPEAYLETQSGGFRTLGPRFEGAVGMPKVGRE